MFLLYHKIGGYVNRRVEFFFNLGAGKKAQVAVMVLPSHFSPFSLPWGFLSECVQGGFGVDYTVLSSQCGRFIQLHGDFHTAFRTSPPVSPFPAATQKALLGGRWTKAVRMQPIERRPEIVNALAAAILLGLWRWRMCSDRKSVV